DRRDGGHGSGARAQSFSEVLDEWVAEQLLEGAIGLVRAGVFPEAEGHAEDGPVGGAVAGASKAIGIDEGLGEVDGVRVNALPVGGEPPRDRAEEMRREVG